MKQCNMADFCISISVSLFFHFFFSEWEEKYDICVENAQVNFVVGSIPVLSSEIFSEFGSCQ